MVQILFPFVLNSLSYITVIMVIYHTSKEREIKFKPRIKLNHNTYMSRGVHKYEKEITAKFGWCVMVPDVFTWVITVL